MASVLGAQDGLGDGLGVANPAGAEAATGARLKAGTAALTELN
jgi:hypothetical protein